MKAIILAAWEWTRLRPLTNTIPKPLIKIAWKPIIEHNLEHIHKYVSEIIIIVKYKKEQIKDYFWNTYKNTKITYREQWNKKWTWWAIKWIKFNEDVLIINWDSIFEKNDLEKIIQSDNFWVLVKKVENPKKYWIFEINEKNNIKKIIEKPKEYVWNLASLWVYKFNSNIFDYIDQIKISERWEYELTDALNLYLNDNNLKPIKIKWEFIDVWYVSDICELNKNGIYKAVPQSFNDSKNISFTGDNNIYGGEWDDPFKPLKDRAQEYSAFNRNYVMSWYEPHVFGSHAEARLCKAEAIAMGVVSGDAKAEYEAGIKSSINRMFNPSYTQDDNFKLDIPTTAEVNAMLSNPLVSYDSASDKLEAIRTQRWIDYFQRPNEGWAVIRRTGSPADRPAIYDDNGTVEMANRIIYPQDAAEYNKENYDSQVAKMGKDDLFTKVWWDK